MGLVGNCDSWPCYREPLLIRNENDDPHFLLPSAPMWRYETKIGFLHAGQLHSQFGFIGHFCPDTLLGIFLQSKETAIATVKYGERARIQADRVLCTHGRCNNLFGNKAVQHCFWYMVGELQENHLKSASVFHKGWCMLGVLWLPAIRQRAVFAPCTQLDKVTERICDLSLFQAQENCATASPLQQPNSYHPYQFYIPFTDFDRVSAVRVWNLIMRCCRLVAVHRTERCHPLDLLEAQPQQLPASGRTRSDCKGRGFDEQITS